MLSVKDTVLDLPVWCHGQAGTGAAGAWEHLQKKKKKCKTENEVRRVLPHCYSMQKKNKP